MQEEAIGVEKMESKNGATVEETVTEKVVKAKKKSGLSERDLEIAQLAVEKGFYKTPKQCSQADIAKEVGVSTAVVSNALRAVEEIAVPMVLVSKKDRLWKKKEQLELAIEQQEEDLAQLQADLREAVAAWEEYDSEMKAVEEADEADEVETADEADEPESTTPESTGSVPDESAPNESGADEPIEAEEKTADSGEADGAEGPENEEPQTQEASGSEGPEVKKEEQFCD